jgi:hypothetical protein
MKQILTLAAAALIIGGSTCSAASVILSYHNGTTSIAPITAAPGIFASNSSLVGSESWRTSWGSAGATPAGPLAGSAVGSNWRLWRAISLNDVASNSSDYAGFVFNSLNELELGNLSFDLAAASDNAGTINGEYNVFVSKNGGAFISLGSGIGTSLVTAGGWANNTVVVDASSVGTVQSGDQLDFRIGLADNSGSNSKGVFLQGIQLEATDIVEMESLLRVDLGPVGQQVEADYGAFSFGDGAASPQSQTYNFGDTGYDSRDVDDGTGIEVTISTKETALRMIDRGGADNLDRDWATAEPGVGAGQVPDNYIDITLSNLDPGKYTFASEHIDTGNQVGVMDVQLSVDGGATFADYIDNVSYGNFLRTNLLAFDVEAGQDVIIRYLAGGGLFGSNGQTTNTVASNRLLPINGFALYARPIPEPGTFALAALGLVGLATRRRR